MKLDTLMLADAAEMREGLLFVLGGWIDTITVGTDQAAPYALRSAVIVRVMFDRTECEREHQLELRLDDEDGQPMFKVTSPVTPPPHPDAGRPSGVVQVLQLQASLPKVGGYQFAVLVDGQQLGSMPLYVKEATPPEEAA